jgi:5-formyltetrahydrofolate cyclo-ligase
MKDDLRYKYKIKRKYFMHSQREVADGAIHDTFFELYGDRKSFFIYNSFGSEADTKSIISALIILGKDVYLPKTVGDKMYAVKYDGCEEHLVKSNLGIYEPQGEEYDGDFDVVVVPLLAINSRGYRLGYGGGYYDKFLKNTKAIKVGIGYSLQITDEFEEDEWDVPLDAFICEKGVYGFGTAYKI